ncbi:MAG: DUF1801 domain-containing protein [Chitinophagaceae bacterium]|nr:MAG: DUF1801 domain-containing protein [Chitinophagaceae bacterium]
MKKQIFGDIDSYIDAFPAEVRDRLLQIRRLVIKTIPGAEESIRYNMPAFKLNAQYLYIAAYKKHIGMYAVYGLKSIEKSMAPYKAEKTKDSLHFPHDKPLPFSLIEKIIRLKAKAK